MIAGTQEAKHGVDACHSGGKSVSCRAAFEFGESAFERFAIRMIGARVIVAVSIFSELGLHVGGRLVDRSDDGACGRIRLLTDVDGVCSETHEDSCLSNEHKLKLFDDSRHAVRECEEVHEAAEVEIVCVRAA